MPIGGSQATQQQSPAWLTPQRLAALATAAGPAPTLAQILNMHVQALTCTCSLTLPVLQLGALNRSSRHNSPANYVLQDQHCLSADSSDFVGVEQGGRRVTGRSDV